MKTDKDTFVGRTGVHICRGDSQRSGPNDPNIFCLRNIIGTQRRLQNRFRCRSLLSLLFIGIMILSINQPVGADIETYDGFIETSLIKLIVNPDKYDGKRVRVVGFIRNEFEDTTLFITKDDADYLIEENGIWIRIPSSQAKSDSIENVKRGYVRVEGTFRKALSSKPGLGRGHMGMFQGEITEITTLRKEVKVK
jgi:hypothetical protein